MKSKRIGFKRLLIGFAIVASIALFNVIFNFITVKKNQAMIEWITNVIYPYTDKLGELELMVMNSKMLTTNWVYLPFHKEDRKVLQRLHQEEYPHLKQELLDYMAQTEDQADKDSLTAIFRRIEQLQHVERQVMSKLLTFQDYEDGMKVFQAEEIVASEVIPQTLKIKAALDKVIRKNREEANRMKFEMLTALNRLHLSMLITGIVLCLIVLVCFFYINEVITKPVLAMKKTLLKLSEGVRPEQPLREKGDIIGEMAAALNKLSSNLATTTNFAHDIGRGNLSAEFTPLSNQDMLGSALIEMRNSLRAYSEEMETKVNERTEEINEQHEEMQAQNEAIKQAYEEIQRQKDNIDSSIRYAKSIQEAMLPTHEEISRLLPEHFILFKPRDIVSGDFYWFSRRRNKVIIAATDCTGHGIPGALMAMVGSGLLSQIVNERGITQADAILNKLHQGIRNTFRQSQNQSRDGMDIALCVIDLENRVLEYAGAKNPLLLVQPNEQGQPELKEIKANKTPIGGDQIEDERVFTCHRIDISVPSTFYIFSDGFQDQFGGATLQGRKFMVKRFRDTIFEHHDKPMNEQKEILEQILAGWMGKLHRQLDDILIIGVRIPESITTKAQLQAVISQTPEIIKS